MGIVVEFLMGDYTGCVGDAVTGQRLCVPLSFSKRNIYHVEVAIEDVDGKGSFGESSAVACAPWEVGTIVTVIFIDNVFRAAVNI